jgi:heat shock protein HtpX
VADASFYDQIAANRRNSFLMAALVVVLLALLGGTIGYALSGSPQGAWLSTAFAVLLGAGSGAFTYFAGDSLVLTVSQAREVDEAAGAAADERRPRARDRGERAAAEGLRDRRHGAERVRDRSGPGARVAGHHDGLLEKLDREELQGVIGHELSHVRNFDIRFSLIVAVMVGVIAVLADFFLRFTFWGGARSRGGDRDGGGNAAQAIIFIVAILLAILAPLISRFIQLAVSRQREYLADSSSVELTRNPYGLERALAKIAGDQEVLEVANRGTQHLYFTNPIKKFEQRSSV